ncbi:cysteine hydrolase [Phycicoccus sp. MAQZ13P-2]|uniref:cysteine hydrolase family protein n=1 Tax=Phycicoccus mangrovi TaxID=2840470 RepID=UPI001C008969|nr:cysteine hydrolase family protein [Phycicoccus mangrovi]MBT9256149.1 cysteine hydrolase [Phycicoccus mangrovi]MBT9273836.1 cysteine hydrolase [Phycicoccus mangrovi]
MTTALLIIDIQDDYFPGGAFPLVGPEEAAARAADVLGRFRTAGRPVVYVQHVWDDPEADFFRPGTPGVEIHHLVAPQDGEPVVQKAFPNAFRDTDLRAVLERLDVDALVVAGMMTSLCVDATVRAAADSGFDVTVVADACAAPDLEFGGRTVEAADVHAAFLAALADSYATVTAAADLDV